MKLSTNIHIKDGLAASGLFYIVLLVTKSNEKSITQQPVCGAQPQAHWFLLKNIKL